MDDDTKRAMRIIMLNSGDYFKKMDKLCSKHSIEKYKLIKRELNWKYPYFEVIDWMRKNG